MPLAWGDVSAYPSARIPLFFSPSQTEAGTLNCTRPPLPTNPHITPCETSLVTACSDEVRPDSRCRQHVNVMESVVMNGVPGDTQYSKRTFVDRVAANGVVGVGM